MGGAKEAGTAACTAVQQLHTEPTLTAQHSRGMRAAFLQAFAALVSALGRCHAAAPGMPCPYPRAPRWVPLCTAALALRWGLRAAGTARAALTQSPAPRPLQPLCSTISSGRCAPLQPKRGLPRALRAAVLRKVPSEAELWCHCRSLAAWHELFRTPRGRGCGCCRRAGAEGTSLQGAPSAPRDNIYQTRYQTRYQTSTRLSRGCLNCPR